MMQVFEFAALAVAFAFFAWRTATMWRQLLREFLDWAKGDEDDEHGR